MSRYSRAALIVLAAVLTTLVLLHAVAPAWMASLSHAIHSR
jgi:hypothetical protein